MARKQTGLRNRYRSGRSQYNIKGKSSRADRYGAWEQGRQVRSEIVAGHLLSYRTKFDLGEGVL